MAISTLRTNRARPIRGVYGNMWKGGVPQNRLLGNLCQAMGLPPAEYELAQAQGVVVEQIIRPTGLLDPVIEVRPVSSQVDDLLGLR